MTARHYKPPRPNAQAVPGSDTELRVPAFSHAYYDIPLAFALWCYLRQEKLHKLPLAEAVAHLARLTHYGQGHCRATIRTVSECGAIWDVRDGMLRLRRTQILQNQAYQRTHVAKKSGFRISLKAFRMGAQNLRQLMALPVVSARKGQPTPLAYTAKCLAISRRTVTRLRTTLEEQGYIKRTRNILRQGIVELGPNGRRRTPPVSGGGWFDYGHFRYRRGPDTVELVSAKLIGSYKWDSSLRSEPFSLAGKGTSSGHWVETQKNLPWVVDRLLSLVSEFQDIPDQETDLFALRRARAWDSKVGQTVSRILGWSRCHKFFDPLTASMDRRRCYQVIQEEAARLTSVLERHQVAEKECGQQLDKARIAADKARFDGLVRCRACRSSPNLPLCMLCWAMLDAMEERRKVAA